MIICKRDDKMHVPRCRLTVFVAKLILTFWFMTSYLGRVFEYPFISSDFECRARSVRDAQRAFFSGLTMAQWWSSVLPILHVGS